VKRPCGRVGTKYADNEARTRMLLSEVSRSRSPHRACVSVLEDNIKSFEVEGIGVVSRVVMCVVSWSCFTRKVASGLSV
jgi:hypothetical protein